MISYMKYNKGIAPIIIILAIVVLGGTVFAVVQRAVLKSYFERGDKPTQAQFSDTIDSSIHVSEDADRTASIQQKAPVQPPSGAGVTGQKVYNPTKEYLVGDTAVISQPIYQAKVFSDTQVVFTLDKAEPVTFRWTPLVPKPQEPSTYRLKVWQLMQGQSGAQAMKTNKPIITKDVADMTEAIVSGMYTGPCRPPYLCDFVWSVETLAPVTTKAETSGATTPTPTPTPATTDATVSTGTRDSTY